MHHSLLIALFFFLLLAGCQSAPSQQVSANEHQSDEAETVESANVSTNSVDGETERSQEDDTPASFETWLTEYRRYAAAQGISEATLSSALDGVRYRPRVLELDRSQPEFVRPIWQYLDTAVSQTRVGEGRARLDEHRDTALRMQERYGVPAEIVVATWGIVGIYAGSVGDVCTREALG